MLHGITIVEFEALGPAPFAGRMFAELGAQVIVVHRRDENHSPAKSAQSPLDAGKRSIALNLKHPNDIEIAKNLVAKADAIIEGFRPGVMEKLGLGPEEMLAENPSLVYGRMTGWGQTGPLARVAGHDLNYISLSGALHYAGLPEDIPQTPATLVGDIGGGALYLIAGVLSGLIHAMKTGRGTVVDAAIVDGSAHMMNLLMSLQAAGALSDTRGQSMLDGPHWSRVYRCQDDRFISVQCIEPKFYREFLDRLHLTTDPIFANQYDRATWKPAAAYLEQKFAQSSRDHWAELFDGSDACVAPVLSPQDAKSADHIRYRKIWQDENGVTLAAPAPRFSTYSPPRASIPERDADRAAILAWANNDQGPKK